MSRRNRTSGIPGWILLPCLVAVLQTGCTSAITTAYLRDAWLDGGEHAEESAAVAEDDTRTEAGAEAASTRPQATESREVDASRRAAAIEEAVSRLSKLGALDETARATLIDTLRRTQQEDWPVVIEAFAETLAASTPPAATIPHVVAKASTEKSDTTEKPDATAKPDATVAATNAADASAVAAVAAPGTAAGEIATTQAEAATPPEPPQRGAEAASGTPAAEPAVPAVAAAAERPVLAVQHASFASRVRAWGDLDRFPTGRFRPGQEVIVYFELENLSASESPTGHTTCIDTVIRLVGPDGESVHEWSFEPIAETLKARRRDYFARYVVRMPEPSPPGRCRLEVTVTDTLAGTTAKAELPFELVTE